MREFIVTNIQDPVKAPITEKGLRHINAMVKEPSDEIVKSLIGTYTTNDIVILRGCDVAVTSGAIPGTGTATLASGAIYYNGDVYLVDANASLSTTNPQTLYWEIASSLVDTAQTKFSDQVDYDFLRIKKMRLVAGTSGGGLANYNATTVKYINRVTNTGYSVASSTILTGTSVLGVAFKKNGTVVFNFQINGTASSSAGGTITINVPPGYESIQQDAGGVGTNPFFGTRENITDATSEALIQQGGSGDYGVTVNSSGQIVFNFGSGASFINAKLYKISIYITCIAK